MQYIRRVEWDHTQELGRSKYDVLTDRYNALHEMLREIYAELNNTTTFGQNCAGCGVLIETEVDFMKHFLIDNAQGWLNLGYCPNNPRNE